MVDVLKIKRNVARMVDQGAPESEIDAYVAAEGVTPQILRAVPAPKYDEKAATDRMYEGRARAERDAHPTRTAVRDKMQALVEGSPIGSWFDEGIATLASVLPESMGGQSYADAKGVLDADRRIREAEATKVGTLPVVGDVTTNGLTKVAGGILSAPMVPVANVFKGTSLLPQMGNAAVTGAVAGGIYGAGEGEGADRIANAAIGAGVGAAGGAVIAPVARGLGNAAEYVGNRLQGLPQELSGIHKGAVKRLARAAADDDLVNRYSGQVADLGPEGMLADMGTNLRGQAEAIANQPGAGKRIILDADKARMQGADARIRQDINAAFGPEQNLVQLERTTVDAANRASGPYFQQFHGMAVPFTQRLQDVWARIPRRIMQNAQEMAQVRGEAFQSANGEPTAIAWDYVKRAIQDEIDLNGARSGMGGALTDLDNALRQAVDATISPNNPAASVWARGRALAGDGKQFQQGLAEGGGVFSRPKTHSPDQVAEDLANATPVYTTGYRAGARGDLANMMNDAGTQFGPAGDKAARKGLWSPNAERKVRQLSSTPDAADAVLRRRNAESTFGETHNALTANSATARRLQAQEEFPNPASKAGGHGTAVTWEGAVTDLAKKGLDALTLGARKERLQAIAENAARVLSATGMQRDQYFNGLRTYLQGRGVSAQQAKRITDAVEAMLLAEVPNAAGAATSPATR